MSDTPADDTETLSSILDDMLPLIRRFAEALPDDPEIQARLREHHRRRDIPTD